MSQLWVKIKNTFIYELPVIRLYALLYFIGITVGAFIAALLRNEFSFEAQLLFSPENAASFFSAFSQQFLFFLVLFFLGVTVIGMPLVPFYPLYKGFSLGLLVALSVIFSGVRGFIFGALAFFAQNFYYTVLGYFLCYSSTRLSISLFTLLQGKAGRSVPYREFKVHIVCFLILLPFLAMGALWVSRVVPILLYLL